MILFCSTLLCLFVRGPNVNLACHSKLPQLCIILVTSENESQNGHFFHFPLLGGHLGTTAYKTSTHTQPQTHIYNIQHLFIATAVPTRLNKLPSSLHC